VPETVRRRRIPESYPKDAAGRRASELRAPVSAPSGRVLVVEEGRRSRQQVSALIGELGFEVEAALSVEAALKKISGNTYDAVFLNVTRGPVGEAELLPQILRIKPDVSVVVLTPRGSLTSGSIARRSDALHCLSKPVDSEALEVVLRSCAERSRLLQMNAELREKTILDDLTTAFNRRHLDAYLDEELDRDRRYGRTFSILFFDLDRLKEVNDRHGHLAGSRVLREVALLIQGKLRKSDRIFRYGGDEFVVTLPETGREGAMRVAHRLRRAIRSHRFLAEQGLTVTLTASFGVATFPQDGSSQEEMIRVADRAMYRVKVKTRDGVAAREAE